MTTFTDWVNDKESRVARIRDKPSTERVAILFYYLISEKLPYSECVKLMERARRTSDLEVMEHKAMAALSLELATQFMEMDSGVDQSRRKAASRDWDALISQGIDDAVTTARQ